MSANGRSAVYDNPAWQGGGLANSPPNELKAIIVASHNAKGGHNRQAALARSFLEQANGDRDLAERLRSEFYSEMGRRSGARRRALAAKRRAELIAAEEARTGVRFTSDDELLARARDLVKR
jgi:hypothetical protein